MGYKDLLCLHVICLLYYIAIPGKNGFSLAASSVGRNETDRLTLLEFKKVIDDPLEALSSWNASTDFCQWNGVTCSQDQQSVEVLDLSSMKLAGPISAHIGNLSFLRMLFVDNNSFSGKIPSEIGRLYNLQVLSLINNSISGPIPTNVSRCTELVVFYATNNFLTGPIPPEFSVLSKLRVLAVVNNQLTCSIPPSLGNLSNLELLGLSENYFDGSIPDTLGQLKKLEILYLSINLLSSFVPPSIFDLSSLTALYLGGNQLSGDLPNTMFSYLPNIELLDLSHNRFTGSIPDTISNASNLRQIQLQLNSLTGSVPSLANLKKLELFLISYNFLGNGEANDLGFLYSLTNTSTLQNLDLNNNNFATIIPEHISNLSTRLETLYLSANQLFGSIPKGIHNLVNLKSLALSNNHLSGIIPPTIGQLRNLRLLYLVLNEFSGNIPDSIGNLTMLVELVLQSNNLEGAIPQSLGNCQSLTQMTLSYNNLSGNIPPSIMSISSLSFYLDLSNNHLNGILPTEVGKLMNLGLLDVSENMLSGEIPGSLGSCVKLEFLNLRGNFFRGPIPSSLSALRGIQGFDVSRNNLSGQIPKFFLDFNSLKHLNLSYNNFEGALPSGGVFNNKNITSIDGNKLLCGGIREFNLPKCSIKHQRRVMVTRTWKIIISLVSGLLCLILVTSILFLCLLRKNKNISTSTSSKGLPLMVSYQSLSQATNNFSPTNLIGVGSFGSVYKGTLDEIGITIAVKVFDLLHHGALRSFVAECEALRNIRHRNLVKILTTCSSIDHHGNDFKALVFEFMANGNLHEWLHPNQTADSEETTSRSLNLLQRINVAVDIACALEYLHHQCSMPIVHCDIKPSNVLLDNDMTAHLGDFGLARFLLKARQEDDSSTNHTNSIGIRGTIGYAAPEYGMGATPSTQGDVYSYGILLLEIFTGKRPTDDIFCYDMSIHIFVSMAFPEQACQVIDPILLQETIGYERHGHTFQELLFSVLEIGIACSREVPQDRWEITRVVAELQSIKKHLLNMQHSQLRNRRNNPSVVD